MPAEGLTVREARLKRAIDVVVAAVLLVAASPVLAVGLLVAAVSTRSSGLFRQVRIGLHGEPFEVMKVRTMRGSGGTTVTVSGDARITPSGALIRKLKIDELPQLVNVLRGEMSLVGPRPDVTGFADLLTGDDRIVLSVRPGVTGPAALAYRHEQDILARVPDPETYNREVIWPDKVRMNREYVENWSFMTDIRCLLETIGSVPRIRDREVQ